MPYPDTTKKSQQSDVGQSLLKNLHDNLTRTDSKFLLSSISWKTFWFPGRWEPTVSAREMFSKHSVDMFVRWFISTRVIKASTAPSHSNSSRNSLAISFYDWQYWESRSQMIWAMIDLSDDAVRCWDVARQRSGVALHCHTRRPQPAAVYTVWAFGDLL